MFGDNVCDVLNIVPITEKAACKQYLFHSELRPLSFIESNIEFLCHVEKSFVRWLSNESLRSKTESHCKIGLKLNHHCVLLSNVVKI